jgi:hypothetical protein
VVADDRQVVAAQLLARELQVPGGAGERLGRIEALVDHAAAGQQALDPRRVARPRGAPQRAPDPARGGGVDLHLQQVAAGLGEDLRQPDRALELRVGGGVGPPGALEQHDRLQRVGRHVGRLGGGLDERAVARGP